MPINGKVRRCTPGRGNFVPRNVMQPHISLTEASSVLKDELALLVNCTTRKVVELLNVRVQTSQGCSREGGGALKPLNMLIPNFRDVSYTCDELMVVRVFVPENTFSRRAEKRLAMLTL